MNGVPQRTGFWDYTRFKRYRHKHPQMFGASHDLEFYELLSKLELPLHEVEFSANVAEVSRSITHRWWFWLDLLGR